MKGYAFAIVVHSDEPDPEVWEALRATLGSIVVRIERAYADSLKGKLRRLVQDLLASWGLGLSLGAGGFSVQLQADPRLDAEGALLRLLDLPRELNERTGKRSLVVFDEVQDLLRVERADGILEFTRGHPQYAMLFANQLWRRTPRGARPTRAAGARRSRRSRASRGSCCERPGERCPSTSSGWRSRSLHGPRRFTSRPRLRASGSRRAASIAPSGG